MPFSLPGLTTEIPYYQATNSFKTLKLIQTLLLMYSLELKKEIISLLFYFLCIGFK